MIHPEIPQMALSIMNPWAWLVATGLKHIENRDQNFTFRGEFAIHAGKHFDPEARADLSEGLHPVTGNRFLSVVAGSELLTSLTDMFNAKLNGGIIGVAEVVDVVTSSESDWFAGPYGLIIRNARFIPFIPVWGMPGFFDWRRRHAQQYGENAAA